MFLSESWLNGRKVTKLSMSDAHFGHLGDWGALHEPIGAGPGNRLGQSANLRFRVGSGALLSSVADGRNVVIVSWRRRCRLLFIQFLVTLGKSGTKTTVRRTNPAIARSDHVLLHFSRALMTRIVSSAPFGLGDEVDFCDSMSFDRLDRNKNRSGCYRIYPISNHRLIVYNINKQQHGSITVSKSYVTNSLSCVASRYLAHFGQV